MTEVAGEVLRGAPHNGTATALLESGRAVDATILMCPHKSLAPYRECRGWKPSHNG